MTGATVEVGSALCDDPDCGSWLVVGGAPRALGISVGLFARIADALPAGTVIAARGFAPFEVPGRSFALHVPHGWRDDLGDDEAEVEV